MDGSSGAANSSKTNRCAICGSEGLSTFVAREMMFGLDEAFRYLHCQTCGHVALAETITDWAKYYPTDYYSFKSPRSVKVGKGSLAALERAWQRQVRRRIVLRRLGLRLYDSLRRRSPEWPGLVLRVGGRDPTILDVGCGNGGLLTELAAVGFRHLYGLEPYIDASTARTDGVVILKADLLTLRDLADARALGVPERFDLIMFHHSFEHILDPRATLAAAAERLSEAGRILVRIPIASSYAFIRYRASWIQLDPPRHVHVFTEKSFRLLCQQTGLDIVKTFYDSTAFQFWGSEQAERGVPLRSPHSYPDNHDATTHDRRRIAALAREAVELNRRGKGDQAGFVLMKSRAHASP
jgi:SAM-dependent methyltransferase